MAPRHKLRANRDVYAEPRAFAVGLTVRPLLVVFAGVSETKSLSATRFLVEAPTAARVFNFRVIVA